MSKLIAELAAAAAAEKGLVFEDAMEDRLCAYSRAVAHFPTAVKEVRNVNFIIDITFSILCSNHPIRPIPCIVQMEKRMVLFTL